MFNKPYINHYWWLLLVPILVVGLVVSRVYADNTEATSEEDLTPDQKGQIANIINQGFGTNSVSAEDIEVDTGLPANLTLAAVQTQKLPVTGHKHIPFEALAYVKRSVRLINGKSKFDSLLIVREYSGANAVESRYTFQSDQKFSEYLFNPILSADRSHIFFQYGANYNGSEYSPNGYGLYVLFLKTREVVKLYPEYLSDVYTPVSGDGRFIAYLTRQGEEHQIRVFDAVKRTSTLVISTKSLYADYIWKPGSTPILCYSALQKGQDKTKKRVALLFDPLTRSHRQYKNDSKFVQFFGQDKFVFYTDSSDTPVRVHKMEANRAHQRDIILKEWIYYFDTMLFNDASQKFALPIAKKVPKHGMLEIGFTFLDTSFHKRSSEKFLIQGDSESTFVSALAWERNGRYIYLGVEQDKELRGSNGTQSNVLSVLRYDIQRRKWTLIEKWDNVCGITGNLSGNTFKMAYNGA